MSHEVAQSETKQAMTAKQHLNVTETGGFLTPVALNRRCIK